MSPVLGIIASSNQQGRGGLIGSYDALATAIVPTGGLSQIVFTGIPAGYENFELRGILRNTAASGGGAEENLRIRFNNDTAQNYSSHWIVGNGASIGSGVELTETSILVAYGIIAMSDNPANVFGTFALELQNYANTVTNKTTRALSGRDSNGSASSYTFLSSGNYRSLNPVSTITLFPQAGSFAPLSQIALYGVK